MECNKLNVEKEKEQLIIDLKSVQKRLENEKARSDTTQANLNSKELELMKTKDLTNACNKQIKHLEAKLEKTKAKKKQLKDCLQEYATLKKGKSSSGHVLSSMQNNLSSNPIKNLSFPIIRQSMTLDDDMDEVERDGEILDDDCNPETVKQNLIEMRSRAILEQGKEPVQDQVSSKNPG